MCIGTIVESGINHAYVPLCDVRLFGKLLVQKLCNELSVAVKEPANQT